ncbi:MAG TPA: hypothetical protein VFS46_04785, partial [Nitrososphaera sp.]|nr:hypothetical protein [Nitrososphaera sp.]
KFGNIHAALLAAALVSAALVSTAGNGAATLPQVSTSTVHVTSPTILKGSIANVQLDGEGNPEWIE